MIEGFINWPKHCKWDRKFYSFESIKLSVCFKWQGSSAWFSSLLLAIKMQSRSIYVYAKNSSNTGKIPKIFALARVQFQLFICFESTNLSLTVYLSLQTRPEWLMIMARWSISESKATWKWRRRTFLMAIEVWKMSPRKSSPKMDFLKQGRFWVVLIWKYYVLKCIRM